MSRAFGRALGYVLTYESSKEVGEVSINQSEKEPTKVSARVLARAFGNELANQSAKELRKVSIRALSSESARVAGKQSRSQLRGGMTPGETPGGGL